MITFNLKIPEEAFIDYLINRDFENAIKLLNTSIFNMNYCSNPQNTTLLIWAAIAESPTIIDKLLDLGADATIVDFRNYNFIDCIKYFSKRNCENYIKNDNIQRKLLLKFPSLYKSLNEHKYLSNIIENEFLFLKNVNELNLI